MLKTKSATSRYMPGLDGLRAISVLAVIAYHLDFGWASGGLLGVGVFFVLSGYLITDQIAAELRREGRLDLKRFWLRRARRLLPAMLLVLAVVLLYLLLFERDRLAPLAGDVWSAVTYTSNWYLIYHRVSYFESFGPPSPFGHLWSLAVEEQFYLLWPLLLPAAVLLLRRRGSTALLVAAGAVASAIAMAALYVPGEDPSRIYYGTDTRAFGLLFGAALALIWPSASLGSVVSRGRRLGLDAVGVGALAAVLLMMRFTSEYDPFLYRGGMVLLSLLVAALVAVLAHPGAKLGAWLGIAPLRWLGQRSYGIYLWHYPVIVLTTGESAADGWHPLRTGLQLAAILLLAALSYRYVEQPIRHGGLAAVRAGWHKLAAGIGSRRTRTPGRPSRPEVALSVAALILLCVSCTGDAHPLARGPAASGTGAPPVVDTGIRHADDETPGTGSAEATGGRPQEAHEGRPTGTPGGSPAPTPSPSPGRPGGHTSSPSAKPSPSAPPAKQGGAPTGSAAGKGDNGKGDSGKGGAATGSGAGITVIGDSVMLNVKPYLEDMLPGIVVDGEVGRQMREAIGTIGSLKDKDRLGGTVVIELGTNGPFTKKQLGTLLDALSDADEIILMNTRVPRKWQDTVNDMLTDVGGEYSNVRIGDWYGESAGHDEYFGKDGVHLGKTGSQAYAKLIADLLGDAAGAKA